MTSLATKIKLYAEANSKVADFSPTGNVEVSDDGSGPTITKWSIDGLSQPTTSQLNSYNANATKEENNNVIRATRKNAYGLIGDQLDLLYKDLVAGKLDATGEWAKAVKKVKDDNPKS
jgi:hypothetical protein|tara:strand:+ start:686 stop:1039 length:354 start_codon:yes stop_codon:yes gene_type:complete